MIILKQFKKELHTSTINYTSFNFKWKGCFKPLVAKIFKKFKLLCIMCKVKMICCKKNWKEWQHMLKKLNLSSYWLLIKEKTQRSFNSQHYQNQEEDLEMQNLWNKFQQSHKLPNLCWQIMKKSNRFYKSLT